MMSVLCTILSSKLRLYSAKSHPKVAGNRICGTLHFKIFRGSMPPDPPRMAHAFGVRPPKTMSLATPLTSTHLYGRRLVLEWADDTESIDELRKKTADYFHERILVINKVYTCLFDGDISGDEGVTEWL